ncbi:type IV pilus biogenesis/stability protein PilW [Curvibacter sp. RS43]|uniref:Type IV pilus biogenesis/stability protein PilW n=2 Tax=Curvibacter microcysteis TaxID=3026419 RepID=A0ABT5MIE8_9BURK|nr:type IV pilus biogenesis/stability protein PilW [Curvibacter sp. RS43]MDD0809729.1 type IV pilus biogenesis/stability protein PilW [Curvibacter sp. RS43]MDD0814906.1 type IV pilus biogenesis/stability protein PilW [Curvibacter sp. HBC28]
MDWQWLRRTVCSGLSALCLAGAGFGLSACGSNPAVPSAQDVSDAANAQVEEGEARRRARIRLELASNYFDQGKTVVALDEVRQVLVADPSFAEAYNLRGLIYMRLDDDRQAEEAFKRALALSPRDSNVLHNYGWMLCQRKRYSEASEAFNQALNNVLYGDKAKTYMAQGLCQARAGQKAEAERNLSKAFELDAANPITSFNLSVLLYQRADLTRAQFYIRRLNNSEYANAESLWLGIRVERRLGDRVAMQQLAEQLKKRFPQSRELMSYERGAFDE